MLPSAVKPAADRLHRASQNFGDLQVGEAFDLPQQQDRALIRLQAIERLRQLQPKLRRLPFRLLDLDEVVERSRLLPPSDGIDTRADGDPMEPRSEGGVPLKAPQTRERADERFLR